MGLGSHSPLTGTQLQTAPSEFKSPLPTTAFHDPPMSLSEVAQSSRQDSPMTLFLNSTSGMNSYWGGDNTMSSSFESDPFDFSRMDFSSIESSDSGPLFRNATSYAPTSTPLQLAPPTSAPLTLATADGFQAMPSNGAYYAPPPTSTPLQSALNANSGYAANCAPPTSTPLQSTSPTSAPLTSTTADGFQEMPPNGAYMPPSSTALQSALNANSGYAANYAPPTSTPLQSTSPTSAPLTSTTADGFQEMPPNGAYMPPSSTALQSALNPNSSYATSYVPPTLTALQSAPPTSTPLSSTTAVNSATNTVMLPTGNPTKGTNEEGDNSKKRKSYEERNAHCILPEGVRHARKGRRMEGAEDENNTAPKKRNTNANANKKGKGNKGKK